MDIPSKVRVGSLDYDIELTDETLVLDTQQCLGIINYDNLKIKIAKNVQSKQKREQTFLHELVHAIVKEYKIDFTEDEEIVVDKLAVGLHQVVRDNPDIFIENCVVSYDPYIVKSKHDINISEITEKVAKRMNKELEKTLEHKKENRIIFTLKDVFELGSFEEIRSYFKKENENIFIKELEVVEEVCNYQETEIVYHDGTSYKKTGQLSVPIEKSLKLPICTPIEIVLQIMTISKENDK